MLRLHWLSVVLPLAVVAPHSSFAQKAGQPSIPPPSATLPSLIAMCEDSDGCSNWFFAGNQGRGAWATGAVADLTITHLDATSVTIHREDHSGNGVGILADYTGSISGYWIDGTVTASWPRHGPGTNHMGWRGIIFPSQVVSSTAGNHFDADRAHATVWGVCEDLGNKCRTPKPPTPYMWLLTGDIGNVHNLTDERAKTALFIDTLPDKSVIARRFDFSGNFAQATLLYVGRWDGDVLTGTFRWIWPGHAPQPLAGNWVAIPIASRCGPSLDAASAQRAGIAAKLRDDNVTSFNCLLDAANQGDSYSENAVGMDYTTGTGTAPDYQRAREWFEKAADQGDYMAWSNLAYLHQKGLGTPVNLLLARYYSDNGALIKAWADFLVNSDAEVHRPGGGLNVLGDLLLSVFTGKLDQDAQLSRRVDHEKGVIENMNKGQSRVDAEESFFTSLKSDQIKDAIDNPDPCPFADGATRGTFSQFQNALEDQRECYRQESARSRAFWETAHAYLACVHQYVDSNVIEQHCDYRP